MEFASFGWFWFLPIFIGAIVLLLIADRRGRWSMQIQSDELRRAARELTWRYNQLTSVRQAAKESKQESQRRATELKSLRDTITQLTARVTSLTGEREQARDTAVELQAKVTDLTTRLARADVRRANLEKELSASTLMRLEVLSQLRTDETQRIRALNRLRQPGGGVAITPVSPIASRRVDTRLSPLSVAKSPSESCLTNLQPDLNADSSEDEVDMRALEDMRVKLERRMRRALAGQRSDVFRVSTIELGKAAVTAKGIAMSNDVQAANTGTGICHSTYAEESVSKIQNKVSMEEAVKEGATAENGEVRAQQKQAEDEHWPPVAKVALGMKAEVGQEEQKEESLDVSETPLFAVVRGGEVVEAGNEKMKPESTDAVDMKAGETSTQNASSDKISSCEITNEIVAPQARPTTLNTQADEEEQEDKLLDISVVEYEEKTALETEKTAVKGDSEFISTSPTGTMLGNVESARKEEGESACKTDGITTSEPTSYADENPDGFVARVAEEITIESKESSDGGSPESPSRLATGTMNEFVKPLDENGDRCVLETMRDTEVPVVAAADEHSNDCGTTSYTCAGPNSDEEAGREEDDSSSTLPAAYSSAGSHPGEAVDDEESDCSLVLPPADIHALPLGVETANKEEDYFSSALPAADTKTWPQSIEAVDEEEDNCSLRLREVGVCAGPQTIEAIDETEYHCFSASSATYKHTGPQPIEAADDKEHSCSSPLPVADGYARPLPTEAAGKWKDDFSPALPVADITAGPQPTEIVDDEEDDCSSALPGMGVYAGPQNIKTVNEKEDDCPSASPPTDIHARPLHIEAADKEEDDYPSALDAAGTYAGPQPIEAINEEEGDCSSALPATVTHAGIRPIEAVNEEEGECSSALSAGTEFKPVLIYEGHEDGSEPAEMMGNNSDASATTNEKSEESASREIARVEPEPAESIYEQRNEHFVILDGTGGPKSAADLIDGEERDGCDSTEMRPCEPVCEIAGDEAEMSYHEDPVEPSANDHDEGCSLGSTAREVPESTPGFGPGAEEHLPLATAEMKPESVVTEGKSNCISENSTPTEVESADSPCVVEVGDALPARTEKLQMVVDAVEETIEELTSIVARQTIINPAFVMEGEVDRQHSEELGVKLHGCERREVQLMSAEKAEAKRLDKVMVSSRSADLPKLGDDALCACKTQEEPLSISRTPWLESLNPKLQKRATSETIFSLTRPVSPDVPGIISSAVMRKTSE